MAKISLSRKHGLTQSRLKQLLHYDPVTGFFTWISYKGRGRSRCGLRAGTISRFGYRRIFIDGHPYAASRLAWFYMSGRWPDNDIDHINGVRDDDRFENLRDVTASQNAANKRTYKNNNLGVKGVRLHRNGTYEARLRVNGELQYLGCYRTIDEAKAVYADAAKRFFGDYARID